MLDKWPPQPGVLPQIAFSQTDFSNLSSAVDIVRVSIAFGRCMEVLQGGHAY